MKNSELIGRNIKIIGDGFNPGIVNEFFLKSSKLIGDDLQIKSNSITTPQFVQIFTDQFVLLCLPDHFQYNFIKDENAGKRFVLGFSKKFSVVNYRAIGINFDYVVKDEKELSKELFFKSESPIFREFNTESSKFGGFLTKKYRNSIINLTVKPTTGIKPDGNKDDLLHFSFNFHTELLGIKALDDIKKSVMDFDKFHSYCDKIMNA
ncbi:MAG TPA: hypothetical protein DER09_02150 [Prolixibacteraceae bacterium]|nr:hypothetical protein [Prolixibacteraceae bacterium]